MKTLTLIEESSFTFSQAFDWHVFTKQQYNCQAFCILHQIYLYNRYIKFTTSKKFSKIVPNLYWKNQHQLKQYLCQFDAKVRHKLNSTQSDYIYKIDVQKSLEMSSKKTNWDTVYFEHTCAYEMPMDKKLSTQQTYEPIFNEESCRTFTIEWECFISKIIKIIRKLEEVEKNNTPQPYFIHFGYCRIKGREQINHHAVDIFIPTSQQIHFFDPNTGVNVYKINLDLNKFSYNNFIKEMYDCIFNRWIYCGKNIFIKQKFIYKMFQFTEGKHKALNHRDSMRTILNQLHQHRNTLKHPDLLHSAQKCLNYNSSTAYLNHKELGEHMRELLKEMGQLLKENKITKQEYQKFINNNISTTYFKAQKKAKEEEILFNEKKRCFMIYIMMNLYAIEFQAGKIKEKPNLIQNKLISEIASIIKSPMNYFFNSTERKPSNMYHPTH